MSSLKARVAALEKRLSGQKDKPVGVVRYARCFVAADSPLRGRVERSDDGLSDCSQTFNVFYYTENPYWVSADDYDEYNALVDQHRSTLSPGYNWVSFVVCKPVQPMLTTNM